MQHKLQDLEAIRNALMVATAPDRNIDLMITNLIEPFDLWGTPIPYEWGVQKIEPGSQSIAVVAVPEMPIEVRVLLEKDLFGMERSVIIPRKYTESIDSAIYLFGKTFPRHDYSVGNRTVSIAGKPGLPVKVNPAITFCLLLINELTFLKKAIETL